MTFWKVQRCLNEIEVHAQGQQGRENTHVHPHTDIQISHPTWFHMISEEAPQSSLLESYTSRTTINQRAATQIKCLVCISCDRRGELMFVPPALSPGSVGANVLLAGGFAKQPQWQYHELITACGFLVFGSRSVFSKWCLAKNQQPSNEPQQKELILWHRAEAIVLNVPRIKWEVRLSHRRYWKPTWNPIHGAHTCTCLPATLL